jgi:hypothetical protein
MFAFKASFSYNSTGNEFPGKVQDGYQFRKRDIGGTASKNNQQEPAERFRCFLIILAVSTRFENLRFSTNSKKIKDSATSNKFTQTRRWTRL